jgi:hypothetical protein
MDARRELDGVDDPQLGDAEGRIERGLAAEIVAEAGVGNLDDETRRRGAEAGNAGGLGEEDEIRFEGGVRRQAKRGLDRKMQVVRLACFPPGSSPGAEGLR